MVGGAAEAEGVVTEGKGWRRVTTLTPRPTPSPTASPLPPMLPSITMGRITHPIPTHNTLTTLKLNQGRFPLT